MTKIKKIFACMLAVGILSCTVVFADNTDKNVSELLAETAQYVYENVSSPQNGSIGGEWAVIGLARSGINAPAGYFERYYKKLTEKLKECNGILHEKKYTEYSRTVLAVTAIGGNPSDVGGYNLLSPLSDYEKTVWQGANGAIWALIALDSLDYDIAENNNAAVTTTRKLLKSKILSMQNSDGGFSITANGESDADITAMSLTALAPYRNEENVAAAAEKALNKLSEMQNENGGFSSGGNENCESTAQVLIALSTLGISSDDARFIKNGNGVLDALKTFAVNGGFKHTYDENGVNLMSAEQALCALAAYDRFIKGENTIYKMSDRISAGINAGAANDDNNRNAVKKNDIIFKDKTFADISDSKSRQAIEELAKRGIISGRSENEFKPFDKMTRAEFAAISVKALGIEKSGSDCFNDVLSSDWFYGYIGAAFKNGIVNGISESEFNPNGTITRAEALAMVARAAKLCGLEEPKTTDEARDLLAIYYDYAELPQWAQTSAAMCVRYNILSTDFSEIKPFEQITREEIAQMIYNLLYACDLL